MVGNIDELKQYILSQRGIGLTTIQIREALLSSGWSQEDVDSALLADKVVSKKRRWLYLMLALMLPVILVFVGWIYKDQLLLIVKGQSKPSPLAELYSLYCTDIPDPDPITSGVDVMNDTFVELKSAIDAAKDNNDSVRLELIRRQLFSLLDSGKALDSRLFQEVSNLDTSVLALGKIVFLGRDNTQLTDDVLSERAILLGRRLSAFTRAGHTASYYESIVAIDGEQYLVTSEDRSYFKFLYQEGAQKLFQYRLDSYEVGGYMLQGFLAEISLLHDMLPTPEDILAYRQRWLDEVMTLAASTTVDQLVENLKSGDVKSPESLGLRLGLVGYQIARDGNLDEGLPLLQCAAEKYNDDLAMANLGEVYGWGRQQEEVSKRLADLRVSLSKEEAAELETQLTENINPAFLSKTTLPDDESLSFYWSAIAESIDPVRHNVFTLADTSLGWNNIGRLDRIANMGSLNTLEIARVECRINLFVQRRYPELVPGKMINEDMCQFNVGSKEALSLQMSEVGYELLNTWLRSVYAEEQLTSFPTGPCQVMERTLFADQEVINAIDAVTNGNLESATCAFDGEQDLYAVSIPLDTGMYICTDNTTNKRQPQETAKQLTGYTCQ